MKCYYARLILLLLLPFKTFAQCVPPVPAPIITCNTGGNLVDNLVINAGDTYSDHNIGGTYSNITVNGGTLLLCGTTVINGVNFNGGRIVMNPDADVTFNGSFNTSSNETFINYGTATFNNGLNIQGSSSYFFNASTAHLAVNGTLFFNGSYFFNNGTAYATDMVMNGGASICLGTGCYVNTNSIQNNTDNPISVPNGKACISLNSSLSGNNPITADPDLFLCLESTATTPSPILTGAATVSNNCTECQHLLGSLPLKLLSFTGDYLDGALRLSWETTWEENVREFIVERSSDGVRFEAIGKIAANNRASTYQFRSTEYAQGLYRLKMLDVDERYTYSSVVRVQTAPVGLQLVVLSNPVTGPVAQVSVMSAINQHGMLVLLDNTGRLVKQQPLTLQKGNQYIQLELGHLVPGNYLLYFTGRASRTKPVQLVKQ
ncbi:hypothetical protein [Paraflavitalea pollutisoli]|uniref:hypothetical protein n=1 Tax=Paraflavitalea pollutisoli TaxID=3034143 RepID=UPI0023EAC14D|nr:hypothetical protein [Paraflavitalea sp. H1-2-19X]